MTKQEILHEIVGEIQYRSDRLHETCREVLDQETICTFSGEIRAVVDGIRCLTDAIEFIDEYMDPARQKDAGC